MTKYRTQTITRGIETKILILTPNGSDIATTHDPIWAETMVGLLNDGHARHINKLEQAKSDAEWQALRQAVALRMARMFIFSRVQMPGCVPILEWIKNWIDEGVSEPMPWPGHIPQAVELLGQWGFQAVSGKVGLKLPGDAKETVQ